MQGTPNTQAVNAIICTARLARIDSAIRAAELAVDRAERDLHAVVFRAEQTRNGDVARLGHIAYVQQAI